MDIIVKRNTRQTLTFRKPGDYSGDTVVFTMKKDKSLTSKREVDLVATVTYSASTLISTFEVDLFPSTSASLVNDVYPFDLRVENSSTDREPLESGNAYIDKSVRNGTDGSAVATTSNVTVLTGADFNAGDSLVSDGTAFVGETASERRAALGSPLHTCLFNGFMAQISGADASEVSSVSYNDFDYTPTIAGSDGSGSVDITLGQDFGEMTKSYAVLQLTYGGVLNNLPTNFTVEITEISHGWRLQFKENGVNAPLPHLQLVYYKAFIQQWKA